ncbi:MAG: carboxyl-terminal protease [Verrucomicrobiales bacterium]|nr:carboxyl-terminal protease [Verrucomicrobiales bacterium]
MKNRFVFSILFLALAGNLVVGTHVYRVKAATEENPEEKIRTFIHVLETVRSHYVDGDKVAYQKLVYSSLKGMIAALDPHSEFMEPPKYTAMKSDTRGAFGGIGVIITLRTNDAGKSVLTVSEPMDETPAAAAGIIANDQIIRIEGRSTIGFTIQDAVNKLRGKAGTKVTITVFRREPSGKTKTWDVTLTRSVISVSPVRDWLGADEFPLDENGIGYVRLRQFGEKTANHLEKALKKMEKSGMKALVLDLRDNPGGLLDQAVEVAGKFLPRGTLIVSTEARNFEDREEYKSSGLHKHPNYKIAVLVNGGSASASEIVAGCLQDLNRAVIIGERTFGKGSVQSILPLEDGSALRLTTAKYYTPSHKVIHERGISPDIRVSMSPETERLVALQRMQADQDFLTDEEKEAVRNAKDPQMERARDMLKGLLLLNEEGKPAKKTAKNTH